MDPLIVSAQYAAFVWFTHDKPVTTTTHEDARQFAKDHWLMFLPNAHEGLGRLLLRISESAEPRGTRPAQTKESAKRTLIYR